MGKEKSIVPQQAQGYHSLERSQQAEHCHNYRANSQSRAYNSHHYSDHRHRRRFPPLHPAQPAASPSQPPLLAPPRPRACALSVCWSTGTILSRESAIAAAATS
nr:hypothetical protein Iba_chr13fCG0540 [Ipomoea batatas]